MNPFDAIAGILPGRERKSAELGAPVIMRAGGGYSEPLSKWDERKAIEEAYASHVWSYAAMEIRATAAMTVPLVAQVFNKRSETWESTTPGQFPDLQKWLLNPNPGMSRAEFVYRGCLTLDATGNFLNDKRTRGDDPRAPILATWPLPVGKYKPKTDGAGYAESFKHINPSEIRAEDRARNEIFRAEQTVHWMYPNILDPSWGMPKLKPAAAVVDADRAADLWNRSAMKRRAVKDMLLTLGGSGVPTPEQFKAIKEMAQKELEGPDAAHGVGIIPGDWKAHEMSRSPVEMDFLAQQRFVIQKISAIFDLLPALLSPEAATYSNLAAAVEWVYDKTLPAFFTWFLGPINRVIVPSFDDSGNVRVIADWGRVEARRKAMFQRVETLDKLVRAGTPYNEAVEFLGLDLEAVEGGDDPHGVSLALSVARERSGGLPTEQAGRRGALAARKSLGPGGRLILSKYRAARKLKQRRQAEPLFATVTQTSAAVRREFLAMARDLVDSVSADDVVYAARVGDAEDLARVAKLDQLVERMARLEPVVVGGAQAGAEIGFEQVVQLLGSTSGLSIDDARVEAAARRLAKRRADFILHGVDGTGGSDRGFKDFIAGVRALDPDLVVALASQLPLLALIGRPNQNAALKMVEGLHQSGTAPEVIADKLARLSEKGLADHATFVGGDQGHGGVIGGQRDAWGQLRDDGVVLVSVWVDSDDDNVCEECISLDGQEKQGDEAGEGFYISPLSGAHYLGPPEPHMKCRCGEVIGSADLAV